MRALIIRLFFLLKITFITINLTYTSLSANQVTPLKLVQQRLDGGYAVVVSEKTYTDPQWQAAIKTLLTKYKGAFLICYTNNIENARVTLSRKIPRYTAFVATPEEVTREFVISVNRMTRALDDDPYPDTIWGIITGYSINDVFRIITNHTPLVVKKGLGGTAIPLEYFEEGMWYDEVQQGHKVVKRKGSKPQDETAPSDTTEELAKALTEFKPDFFITSGHATERDWQIGYSYKNGQFICKDGILYGKDTQGKLYKIESSNPKIYLAAGNCLIGHIKDRESMALAFLGSCGVQQMIGYTVLTWYGYTGWGVRNYFFFDMPRERSFAEAFHCIQIALNYDLTNRFGELQNKSFSDYDLEKDRQLLTRFAKELNITNKNEIRDCLGLLWDRDVVAFYGDPAWEARLAKQQGEISQKLREKLGVFTFEFTFLPKENDKKPINFPVPIIQLLPFRIKNVRIIEGGEYKPVIADNFILVGNHQQFEREKIYKIVFRADKI